MFYRTFVVVCLTSLLSYSWAQTKGYSIFGSSASERVAKGAAGRTFHK